MSPRKETTHPGNISPRIPSERRDVWPVTPSCWNHTFSAPCSSKRSSNLGRRKFPSIAQYRSEVIVTVTLSSLKEVRTPHTKLKYGTPHITLGLWSGRWWSSRGLLWDQYRKRMRMARCVVIGEPPFWWTPRQRKRGAYPTKSWCDLRMALTQLSNITSPLFCPHSNPS
jgi:hypothetical protein